MMTPRVIETIDTLRANRLAQLTSIFSTIAYQGNKIQIFNKSSGGNIFFSISDGYQSGNNYTEWRFRTIASDIRAHYHELWTNLEKNKFFLNKSYFHLYQIFERPDLTEKEYVLLHCDACEPDNTPHAFYKQSPHVHIEAAQHPLPKAHIALYNGRINSILKDLNSFNDALSECINMINDQIIQLHVE